jgi:hypothetical protein
MAPIVFVSIEYNKYLVRPMNKSEKRKTKALYSASYDMNLLPLNVIKGDFCSLGVVMFLGTFSSTQHLLQYVLQAAVTRIIIYKYSLELILWQ